MPANSGFRLQGEKVHLKYETHVDKDAMHVIMLSFGPMKIYSLVHELGAEDEEGLPETATGGASC